MDTYNEAEFIRDYVPGGKAKALLKKDAADDGGASSAG